MKLLDENCCLLILEPYYYELEFFVVYKAWRDSINYLYDVTDEIPKSILLYLRNNLLQLFPNCAENPYFNNDMNAEKWKKYKELLYIDI